MRGWRSPYPSWVVALTLLLGCVDTSPVDYVAPGGDAGGSDGAGISDAIGSDSGLVAACQRCLTAGPCKPQYDACSQQPKCDLFIRCLVQAYCLNLTIAVLSNPPACFVRCSDAAGITGQGDPALSAFVPAISCATEETGCGGVCDIGTVP